ncbi:hypothetical protein OVA13_11820 [Pseudoxanthomonas sp. SL93]|uniref:hypothetical protein n=1 Tax=Pseudoxanthomonas sp. SL93 TaxID=2995142 RepID=UPI00226EAAA3|nr:hypothetical protein [Pseudoxanthomonas sp. SL93]WAC62089.1 hypothetical protein OVA13_11820 [Pseudoxanthomonas sp. SL93]
MKGAPSNGEVASQILAVLSGHESDTFHATLLSRRRRYIGERLAALLTLEKGFVDLILAAPATQVTRVLEAPQTWEVFVLREPAQQLRWLDRCLHVEAVLASKDPAEHESVVGSESFSGLALANWTALGDAALLEGKALFLPRLNAGCVVDGLSTYATGPLSQVRGGHQAWSPGEFGVVLSLIVKAAALVESGLEGHASVFRSFTRSVVVRSDPASPSFRSSSTPVANGMTVLHNPSSAYPEAIYDALIHEAVHSMLDIVELETPLTTSASQERVIRSPWTGQMLSLRTYVHAVMIWYALAKGAAHLVCEGRRGGELLDRSAKGFGADVIAVIGKRHIELTELAQEVLCAIRDATERSIGHRA